MRKLVIAAATVACLIGLLGVPARATESQTVDTEVVSTPDNGCPAWARDTLTRTTTITETGDGWVVAFHDQGTFETADGETGTVTGDVSFAPTDGVLVDPLPDGDTVDNGAYDCKSDVPADGSTVGSWPTRYVTGPAPAIESWSWTYTLCGVSFTETDGTPEVDRTQFPAADSDDCQPEPPPSTTVPDDTTTTTTAPTTTTTGVIPLPPADDAAPVAAPATPVVATPSFTG